MNSRSTSGIIKTRRNSSTEKDNDLSQDCAAEDETGTRVSHSGRPFEEQPYLTYVDTSYTIDASALHAGKQYTLSVEHALLTDTQKFDGVPAMTTYAVTSELDAWHERLLQIEDITFLKELSEGGFVRSFLLEDPGGYTVEFFQWNSESKQ